jgi:hypothetical protein
MEAESCTRGILAQTVTSVVLAEPRKLQNNIAPTLAVPPRESRRNQVKEAKAMKILDMLTLPNGGSITANNAQRQRHERAPKEKIMTYSKALAY